MLSKDSIRDNPYGFEKGDIEKLDSFLEKKVLTSFKSAIEKRKKMDYIDAKFIGMRDIRVINACLVKKQKVADVTLSFKSDNNCSKGTQEIL